MPDDEVFQSFPRLYTEDPYQLPDDAVFEVTTTEPGQSLDLYWVVASVNSTIEWGDGDSDVVPYEGSDFSHVYAEPGTYTVRFPDAAKITWFELYAYTEGVTVTLNSISVRALINLEYFYVLNVDGIINVADWSHWRPETFAIGELYQDRAKLTLSSQDVVGWDPDYFEVYWVEDAEGLFDSADISHWRPTTFYMGRVWDSEYTGRLALSDFRDWRPEVFGIYAFGSSSFQLDLDSSDVGLWRPRVFELWQLAPHNGNYAVTTGLVDSADFADWNIQADGEEYSSFALDTLPPSVPVSLDFAHFAGWNPQYFTVRTMPHAEVTLRPGIIALWSNARWLLMTSLGLSTADVDLILDEAYTAAQLRSDYEGSSIIQVQDNSPATGTYQSACPPTTGKEFAYALLNDPCNVIPKHYTSVQYDS